MSSKLTQLAKQKSASDLQTMSRQSFDWLKKKINQLGNVSSIASSIVRERSGQYNRFDVGGLFFFYYDPKTKSELPYYDRFPLVLVLEKYSDGFLGLNLHYLPLNYRFIFLDKLMDYASLNKENDINRMRVTYDILSASKRYKEFRPCIKKYLNGHVQSRIIAVQPNEWDVAAFLPVQQFRKASAQEVWNESLEEIRKN
jgi:hypothetical protein